jgi:hypothetical protein
MGIALLFTFLIMTRIIILIEKQCYLFNRPRRPMGFCDVEGLTFYIQPAKDGGEVVSLTRWPGFTPQEDSWYSFLLEAKWIPAPYCGWKD